MVKIDYKKSHAYPRTKNGKRIMESTEMPVAEVADLIKEKIKDSNNFKRDRAMFATMAIYGFRVSEFNKIKKKNIKKFLDQKTGTEYIVIEVETAKNRYQKRRRVPASYYIYKELFELIFDYLDTITHVDDDELLFPIKRIRFWYLTKAYFGDQYSPHWWRHYSASHDARMGMPPPLMQKKFGWAKLQSAQPYLHLNTLDIIDFQNKAKENEIKEIPKPVQKETQKEEEEEELEF